MTERSKPVDGALARVVVAGLVIGFAALSSAMSPAKASPTVRVVAAASTRGGITLWGRGPDLSFGPLSRPAFDENDVFVNDLASSWWSELHFLLFAQLVAVDRQGHLVPDLLARIPTVRNGQIRQGGRVIVLELRPHLAWSSGAPLTSRDVQFGWQVQQDAYCPQDSRPCGPIASITVDGARKATMRLKRPYAPVIAEDLPPLVPHAWSALGGTAAVAAQRLQMMSYANPSDWTDGPYKIARYVKHSLVVLQPMPYYHAHPGPYLRRIVDRSAPGAGSFQGDVSGYWSPGALPALLHDAHGLHVTITPSFTVESLQFNVLDRTYQGQPNPVTDVRVRQALSLALNRTALVHSQYGLSQQAARPLLAYTPFLATPLGSQEDLSRAITGTWDPLRQRYVPYGRQSLADARALLTEAGYPRGFHLDVLSDLTAPALWAKLQQEWEALGVTASPEQPQRIGQVSGCDAQTYRGDFEVYLSGQTGGPDPDDFRPYLDSHFLGREQYCNLSPYHLNFSGTRDQLIDQGFARGATEAAPSQRQRWYSEVQVEVSKKAPLVPLLYVPEIVTTSERASRVTGSPIRVPREGFSPAVQSGAYAWNAWQWRYVP